MIKTAEIGEQPDCRTVRTKMAKLLGFNAYNNRT